MSTNAEYVIRPATPDDVDAILQLIIDLAVYEKEPDAVTATPALLKKNLFEIPYAHALLAFPSPSTTQPIGLAIYFFNFSTWTGCPGLYLEDLFVSPSHRSSGIGKLLFHHLGVIAEEKGCKRVDWSVLKWNQPSIDFYEKKLGARRMEEWVGMRLEGEGIEKLREFGKK